MFVALHRDANIIIIIIIIVTTVIIDFVLHLYKRSENLHIELLLKVILEFQ